MKPETTEIDELSTRCKAFEQRETGHKAMLGLPLLARLDGRAFHTYTRGMPRPYDANLQRCMAETTRGLVAAFQPTVGYTQSDEITLCWYVPSTVSGGQYPFDGRFQKVTSILAGYASALFTRLADQHLPERAHLLPHFDCRVWQVPSLQDALDVFVWREWDAVKNSVTMAALAHSGHTELHGKSTKEKLDLLHAKGVNWNEYPPHFKRGLYFQRRTVRRSLTDEEWAAIPEPHRPPRDQQFDRGVVDVLPLEPVRRVPNALELLFPPAESKRAERDASARRQQHSYCP